ncbi:cytochrome P450 [Desulfobotulus sp. H1]|uniref:Cytochrome P450 n=1 Tax=Desulfobotulus pelophilus TaxID=2823377 RepID=A0ABT3N786_9BACT|nr:hypothetical protein [Desulfobotulus pelophilus]MCW7753324.1 cytochrome P450 [Desulfobotulus pelophilus]
MGRNVLIFTKKQLYRSMDKAFDQVKHGIYRRLAERYGEEMDRERAGLMAAAVTNRLFSLPPASSDGVRFLEENSGKVRKAAEALKGDQEILHAVTMALRQRQKLLFTLIDTGKASGSAINRPLDNLMKMGLMAEVKELSEPKAFLKFARKFLQKSS